MGVEMNPKDVIGSCKVPISCVPAPVIGEVALAMMEGALKYGRHNYRDVSIRASVYYDAAFRHLAAWWEGEDIDVDSGLNHITKALATLVVLRDGMMQETWTDDRPPPAKTGWVDAQNEHAAMLIDKYPALTPTSSPSQYAQCMHPSCTVTTIHGFCGDHEPN